MSNTTINREEYKYYVNNYDTHLLGSILSQLLSLDTNSSPVKKQYTISSLYFDTPDSHDLNEKLDGILRRKKHRIRIYNNNSTTVKLETKKRFNTFISKDSTIISTEAANNIIDGNYNYVKGETKLFNSIVTNLKAYGYRSRVVVEYDRQAYYLPFGNIRITLDKNLRTYNTCTNLFNLKDYPSTPVFLDNYQILEVKFSEPLPSFVKNILSSFPLKRCSISKYVLSQRFTDYSTRRDHLINPF